MRDRDTQRDGNTEPLRHKDIGTEAHRDTEAQGLRDTHRETETQGPKDTGVQRLCSVRDDPAQPGVYRNPEGGPRSWDGPRFREWSHTAEVDRIPEYGSTPTR